ncbi:unnamed protein product [Kuraishia capsulata CBS 1993]|uniref:t-SNARE coiled-coil homology domain-containing protein n=1 Tax=Kuraishia capsulata CBS 1993 TaxID=1382522 RepID=W6MNE9_9ASCO|nr:uncharacterized protein KUCA_T00004171001 [Kuraishia capsulata CBS 1993]CDK28189.1 unnamed protein product [Kuraishia capsulata CBS 1993]
MTDLTPFFFKCITIYQEDFKSRKILPDHEKSTTTASSPQDSFIKEALALNHAMVSVKNFVDEIKTAYLLNFSSEKGLTASQRDEIDSQIGLELNKMSKSLQHIETYEAKRVELEQKRRAVPSAKMLTKMLFNGDLQTAEELKVETVNLYRNRILRYLSLNLASISTSFLELKEKRQNRQMEYNKSSLNTTSMSYDEPQQQLSEEIPSVELEHHDEIKESLSDQQIQLLQQENTELIMNLKSEELSKVAKLETSVYDITTLVREIGIQLQNQTEQVNQLLDHQDDMLQDVSMGNKQLIKARERNDKNARRMCWIIVIMGIILLSIDYIL